LAQVSLGVGRGHGQAQAGLAARDGGVADGRDEYALAAESGGGGDGAVFFTEQKGNDGAASGGRTRGEGRAGWSARLFAA